MRPATPRLLPFLAFLVLAAPAGAQSHRIKFDRLSIAQGLSQGSGNAILQDSEGFIWIGTQDGLDRYDGYRVEVFKHDPSDPDSLADNFVVGLYEDRRGTLWIVPNRPGALNSFDLHTGRFRRYVHDPDDPATLPDHPINGAPHEDGDGVLWFPTAGGGIAKLDPTSGKVDRVRHDPEDEASLASDRVSAILEDRSDTLWVSAFDGGLHRRLAPDPARGERFAHYRHDPEDTSSLSHDDAWGLLEDSDGYLWVGTQGGGLNRLDPDRGTFRRFFEQPAEDDDGLRFTFPVLEDRDGRVWVSTGAGLLRWDRRAGPRGDGGFRHYRHDPEDPRSLSNDNPRQILQDRTGDLWIATQGGGLNLYVSDRDGFVAYRHDPGDPTSLGADGVLALTEDRSGILWVGTFGGGVSRFSRQRHKFAHYRHDPQDPGTLADNLVFAIYEDRDQTLWVGTRGGGLHRFDPRREKVTERYFRQPGSPRDLGSDSASAMYEDREGRFWVGTGGAGLVLLDRERREVVRRYERDEEDEQTISADGVNSIFEDRGGEMWIATGFGWNRFDRQAGTFERFRHDPDDPTSLARNNVKLAHEDRSGTLWVATGGGLDRFDRESKTFAHYAHDLDNPESLSHNTIMGLYEDGEGVFWIATYGGGLNRFDPQSERFTHFTTKDGLPNDSLYGVLPDGDGNLWLSSNHGLSKLDPRRVTFTNYDVEDGLQSNEFNDRAYFLTERGEMYFGGLNGFNRFHPAEIEPSSFVPPVVLTDFRKFDRRVELDRALEETERVVVSYKDTFFSFEFAALDYSKPDRNRYAYKLEGFDDDWVPAGGRRFASYTNLDGGTYTFRVRGSNGDGVWNEEGASIEVVVIPPPWKTWWAYTLYVLFAGGAVVGYVRYKTATHEAELERQRQEADRLRQIDRMKDEFLANTSHELRTPLNGIIGIAESLLDGATGELPEPTRSNLFMVVSSGRRLSHLVDDILDFSKLKSHDIALRTHPVGLRRVVETVLTLSAPLAAGKELELLNEVPEDLPPVAGDGNRLQQIFHNLVGNAVKFTDAGSVRVEALHRDGLVEVAVADTGIGIPPDKLDRIFESFEQADGSSARTHGGTGLGLTVTRQLVELHGGEIRAESQLGAGSRLVFTLPVWTGGMEEVPAEVGSGLAQVRDASRGTAGSVVAAPEPGGRTPPTMAAAAGSPEAGNGGRTAGQNGKVLIVDDEPINLQVLRNILTLSGFGIAEAYDGPQCLRMLAEGEAPDIILLDVMMPGMTGFEVTDRIRREFSSNDLPILLVTAKNQIKDLEQGLASGANDYLTKPFSKAELLARMRTHLSLSRAHSAEAENRRKTDELEQARRIQLSLLPKAPPTTTYLEIAAHMETATEVGGDYYDFFPQDDGSLYVVTGDATGHGISAGMMVSMTKSALKALDVQSPHMLLAQLNQVMKAVQLERMQMALNVTYITPGEIAVSSAAMPPAILYRGGNGGPGGVEEILLPGLPLGGLEEAEYSLRVKDFGSGDVLLLLSDGLPELADGAGDPLGYDAVGRCLAENGGRPAAEILEALLDLGQTWSGGAASEDDVTLVVVRRV